VRSLSQRECLHCGRPENLWPDNGHEISDQGYCCRGCAEDYVCTCHLEGSQGRVVMLDFNHR
jgi:hypothetical protein